MLAKLAHPLEKVKRADFPSETEDLRPKTCTRFGLLAGAPDSRLSGGPVQPDSAFVDGRRNRALSGNSAALFAVIIAVIDVRLIGTGYHETIGGLRLIRPHDNGCPLMMLVSVLSVPLDRMTNSSFQRSGVPDNS